MAKRVKAGAAVAEPETGSVKSNPDRSPRVPREAKPRRSGWCKFKSKGRAFIEGTLIEDAEQEITLSPRGSYRQRSNKNLILVEGEVPMRERVEGETKEDAVIAESEFLEDLEDGDPRVGPAPGGLKLIKQG